MESMIEITPTISIDESELQFDFVRAAGPGGQNVNKVSTAVVLRFNVVDSNLPDEVKDRLFKLAGGRINKDGVLVIHARQYRTQEQNRFDAQERLVEILRSASEKPKMRHATRPSVTARAARLGAKKKRGETKRLRRYKPEDWE
jgi:ribosome-associated protein